MNIIAISGHAQNGKDTIAGMLKTALAERGERVLITHYGDLVKYICKMFFGWDGEKDEYGRHLLQYVGTDVVRKTEPEFWVDFILKILRFFGDNWDYVLIPDARFPNEVERLRETGAKVTHLRVIRPNFASPLTEEQQNHPSETALDGAEPDDIICNDADLGNLEKSVRQYVKENIYGE